MSLEIKKLSQLGLRDDNFYHITDENYIYLIENDSNIMIEENINAYLLDSSNNSNIYIKSLSNSNLEYTICNGKNTNTKFDVYGNVLVNELKFIESNENLNVNLLKENATFDLYRLVILDNSQSKFIDYVSHKEKKTNSNISNVGISMNKANINFDTTGKIEQGMSKSVCRQLTKGIITSNESVITSQPILFIDEYDVQANHGASIGKMSDEDLFYLMSRGLSKNDAFLLIVKGVIKPFIDRIPNDELKTNIDNTINKFVFGE